MNPGWILILAACGQTDRWQVDPWPPQPTYAQPSPTVQPAAGSRFSQPLTQPAIVPAQAEITGQSRWGTIQPATQAGGATATWSSDGQLRTVDNRNAAAANPYGAAQWNGQPASVVNQPPPLLPPDNGQGPQTQPWQQQAPGAGASRFSNTLPNNQPQGNPAQYNQPQLDPRQQYNTQTWNTGADSARQLAAEYQSQIDDRWSYYSEFYRQPNPQLPALPAQWQNQPNSQLAQNNSRGTATGAPANNWPAQPAWGGAGQQPSAQNNYGSSRLTGQNTQPGADYSHWDNRSAAAVQGDAAYPYNIYQPQPRIETGTGTTITKTVTDSRGTLTTIQPALPATLPTGRDTQFDRFNAGDNINNPPPQPQLQPPSQPQPPTQPRWADNNTGGATNRADEPARFADAGTWPSNNFTQPQNNNPSQNVNDTWRNEPQTAARVQNWRDNALTASANPNRPATDFGTTGTVGTLNLLNSLVPQDSRQARTVQYEQPLGGGSGLFAAANLGGAKDDRAKEDDREKDATEPQPPWAPLVITLLGLFLSLGGNLYFGRIAFESHFRYRRLLVEGDDDNFEDEEPRGRSSRDERESRRRRD